MRPTWIDPRWRIATGWLILAGEGVDALRREWNKRKWPPVPALDALVDRKVREPKRKEGA